MKLPAFIQAAFVLLIVAASCKKSDNTSTPTPDPVPKADTLTTGWTKLSFGNDTRFYDIFFQNENTGYAIGNKIFKTVNGGVSWDSISPNQGFNLSVTPDGKVFYISQLSGIWKSLDKGINFSSINSISFDQFYDVFFTSNDSGYSSTMKGGLIATVDGGATWSSKTISPDYSAQSINGSSLFFLNSTNGWITNGLAISKTNGSINSWTKCNVGPTVSPTSRITSLYASSANIVYAGCGNGTLLKSTNAGLDFSVIKEFPTASRYLDLHFFDDTNGYALLERCIYKTSDGGINWQTVATLGEGNLVELHFTDANHGWACGSDGIILRYSR